MDEDTFWKIIGQLDWTRTGDDDAVLEPAVRLIASMKVEDILRFSDVLAEKLHALDTRKHCKACYAGELDPDNGDDYISPDDFLYCRCVVVANGRLLFSTVLANRGRLRGNLESEAFLVLAPKPINQKMGTPFNT